MCDFIDCEKWKELDCSQFRADIFLKPTCYRPLRVKPDGGATVLCSDGLVAMQAEAKLFIDANVWDGEDRSGATNDRATFNPDELQELIDDMLEHMSN